MKPLPLDYEPPPQPPGSLLLRRVPWYVSVPLVAAMIALVLQNGGMYRGRSEDAKKAAANADVATLGGQVEAFRTDTGRYPTSDEGLAALLTPPAAAPGWRGPYVKRLPNDPWGTPYVYQTGTGGAAYQVRSAGPDRTAGTADDVVLSGPPPAAPTAIQTGTPPAAAPGPAAGRRTTSARSSLRTALPPAGYREPEEGPEDGR